MSQYNPRSPFTTSNVDLVTNPPATGNVLGFSGGKWIPQAPTGGSGSGPVNMYTVELTRWGIKQGFPSKTGSPAVYSTQNYTDAYNNMMGINNAVSWASSQGYTYVVLPQGNYAVCYANISNTESQNRMVVSVNNLVFDLNGSTFKVLYDSDVRQPYDKILSNGVWVTNTAPTYQFGGTVMHIISSNYVTVKNGKFIGDKVDRSWANSAESGLDISNGVNIGDNCQFCALENIDASFFMADGLTSGGGNAVTTYTSASPSVGYSMGFAVGALDASGNLVSTDTTHCVSNFISVAGNTPYFFQGYGYTQGMSDLVTKHYQIFCYDTNKTFITQLPDYYVLRSFVTPKNCAYVRFVVYETAVNSNGWEMSLKAGYLGHFVTIRNCNIHHNHRGGLSIGVNDMFILNNRFYSNGMDYDYENNLPAFGSNGSLYSTRYHINMEDSQAYNINIIGNEFINGHLGIAARGWNYTIKDNVFQNNNAVTLYKVPYVQFENNYLQNASFGTYQYNTTDNVIRDWHIVNNVIDGYFDILGTAEIDSITGNLFLQQVTIPCSVRTFKNNTFRVDQSIGYVDYVALTTIPIIEGCTFIKSASSTGNNNINIQNAKFQNCTFTRLKVLMNNVEIRSSVITDCSFSFTGAGYANFDGCNFTKGSYSVLNNYAAYPENSCLFISNYDGVNILLKNSNIIDSNSNHTFGINNFTPHTMNIRFENTTFSKTGSNYMGFDKTNGALTFINSTLTCDTAVTFTPNPILRHQFTDTSFTGVAFVIKASDIYYKQADIGFFSSSMPTNGSFKLGQKIWNTNPIAGGSLGWIAITGGTACNNTWASLTDYTASAQIYSGSNVFQAMNSGHSTATVPAFPSTLNGTVQDVAGTSIWSASKAYTVGNAVIPPTSNGFWYECTVGGTSGSSAPTWSTSANVTFTDGTVTWKAHPIITWQNVDTSLAAFKTFGTISS